MKAWEIYTGSNGEATKQFYAELEKLGPMGVVAVNLFRAQKCSARAKVYRGGIRGHGSYRGMAYDRKNWSLRQLCEALVKHGAELGIRFGWKCDSATPGFEECLYVDLSEHGQVSFHSAVRYVGPEYVGEWDGAHASAERIIAFCDRLLSSHTTLQENTHGQSDREAVQENQGGDQAVAGVEPGKGHAALGTGQDRDSGSS